MNKLTLNFKLPNKVEVINDDMIVASARMYKRLGGMYKIPELEDPLNWEISEVLTGSTKKLLEGLLPRKVLVIENPITPTISIDSKQVRGRIDVRSARTNLTPDDVTGDGSLCDDLVRRIITCGGTARVINSIKRLANSDPSALVIISNTMEERLETERKLRYAVLNRHHVIHITPPQLREVMATVDNGHILFNVYPRTTDVKIITYANVISSYDTIVSHGTNLYRMFRPLVDSSKLDLIHLPILIDGFMYGYPDCCSVYHSMNDIKSKVQYLHIPTIGTGFKPCPKCASKSFINLAVDINRRRIDELGTFPYSNPIDSITVKLPSLLTPKRVGKIVSIINNIGVSHDDK